MKTFREYLNEEKTELHEDFSKESDIWSEKLTDKSDDILKALATKIADGKLKPTEKNYEIFKSEIAKSKATPKELTDFVKKIDDGEYSSEFKKVYGSHSQVSELFSFFRQAVLYND